MINSNAKAIELPLQATVASNEKFIVKGLNHRYSVKKDKRIDVLDNIDFTVKEKEFLAIVGPSGCGKSTLLNIMSGLLKPTGGEILLEGEALSSTTKRIGYISQTDTSMPWRTAISNVELGMEIKGVSKKKRREIALKLMQDAVLAGFEKSFPYELSGGMKKRVDIIKVLAIDPEIIFMDEPFGALDVFTREMLQNYILSLWEKTKKTIIFITHDLTEAITLAGRVIILTNRPATVKSEYKIDLPRPRSSFDIRYDKKFIELHKRIWEDLKSEVR
ncbi:ABC transporter ATP-binding protein [Alkaliphilus pronyensis]|uniref:ABC transporter ATP-binding protein n=1 Tax=Alkaliphilus pronyensis TaxID=1482732 RepID=UPI001FAAF349|nr:ABC transporter ATP-binding protein [Alkaliphilus pronyensis]